MECIIKKNLKKKGKKRKNSLFNYIKYIYRAEFIKNSFIL